MRRLKVSDSDHSSRSGPHKRIEKILDGMDINYSSEERFAPYTLDLYLPEWHLAIEVDGPAHSAKKDEVRDQWFLEFHGIPTLRLDAKVWHTHLYIQAKIIAFIEQHADTVETRKDARQSTSTTSSAQ